MNPVEFEHFEAIQKHPVVVKSLSKVI